MGLAQSHVSLWQTQGILGLAQSGNPNSEVGMSFLRSAWAKLGQTQVVPRLPKLAHAILLAGKLDHDMGAWPVKKKKKTEEIDMLFFPEVFYLPK